MPSDWPPAQLSANQWPRWRDVFANNGWLMAIGVSKPNPRNIAGKYKLLAKSLWATASDKWSLVTDKVKVNCKNCAIGIVFDSRL